MKETVEEEKVKIQERVITTKTPDGKTILTKITTLPGEETEEIEEETTETIDGETKTNKTRSQVVKAPFPVSKLPNGKEIPIKGNMKEGETTTEYDEETKTTVVTKRLANGYEQSFSTITPEGNYKSWTKTFFDPVPVEGDEEEEEIEEYEEISTEAAKKTTTTTTNAAQDQTAKQTTTAKPAAAPAKTTHSATPSKPVPAKTPAAAPAAPKPKVNPSEKTVVKKVPNGKQEITTTVDAQGRETTKIHTMTDLPDQNEEYEEYEETRITEEQPKTKKTTTTTQSAAAPQKKPQTVAVPAGKSTTTTVAVPGKNPKDNVLARKVVTKGEEEIQITEEHTETEFSPSKKTTTSTSVVPSNGAKLDPKGKTTVTKVVVPGSQSTVVTKSNEQDGKQIVVKKGPSGTQDIAKTTNPDGSSKVKVTTTVNPEELHIEETETTNITGDKIITTARTEVPIPGKKIVKQLPPTKVAGKGPKTTTTTSTTIMPVGQDRKTTTTKRVDSGTEVSVKTETKDGKTRLETSTKFDPIFHPAVTDDEEEVEEYEETQTFAPVKTKTTTTARVPVEAGKKKPVAASSKTPVAAPKK